MDNNLPPWQPIQPPEIPQPTLFRAPFFPYGPKELLLALITLVLGCLLCNSLFYAWLNLGFAIFAAAALLLGTGYLLRRGHRFTFYSAALLLLCLLLCASFARSDDSFVKIITFLFLLLGSNLSLCLLSGQNRRDSRGLSSLLDVFRTGFVFGFGGLPRALRGLRQGIGSRGTAGKKGSAVLVGLLVAVPFLALVISLLISADAAFDALVQQMPDWNFGELLVSLLFGIPLALWLFTRNTALHHAPKELPADEWVGNVNVLTVNTVLCAVSLVYGVYLVSQLAYFTGGLQGILPNGYTLAEYARRGFFELAWLCAINLGIIALAVGLVAKTDAAPLSTRLICLFLGFVTLFLAASASAKMFLYIQSYGLTRLRVLTQVIILFFFLATVSICLWLFIRKFPYMQAVVLSAMILCGAVAWADVDTVVARYNVEAYQAGKLETVDMDYLDSLGSGAIPYISRLTADSDPDVASKAKNRLLLYYGEDYFRKRPSLTQDFRDWNYVNHAAEDFVLFIQR